MSTESDRVLDIALDRAMADAESNPLVEALDILRLFVSDADRNYRNQSNTWRVAVEQARAVLAKYQA